MGSSLLGIGFLLFTTVFSCAESHGSGLPWQEYVTQEALLRNELLVNSNYSNKIRPAEKVEISLRFNLLSINSLDIKSQTFSPSGWITAKWWDLRLAWDKEAYQNISFIFDTDSKIWRPELIIDNSVSNLGVLHDSALMLRVRHDGLVMWEPPGIYTVHCEVDTTYYPFDGQKCSLDVVSWTFNIDEVNLVNMSPVVNLADYKTNGEWEMINTFVTRLEIQEEENTFSLLRFVFHIHRRPFYYVINIMVPIGVTSVLSILVFVLPLESGEKVSYSLTVLLSYAVLMTIVADNMPSTSIKVSVLSVYLALILFVGCTSVLLSVINLHIFHQKDDRPIPKSLMRFAETFLHKHSVKGRTISRTNSRQRIVPVERVETPSKKQGEWQEKTTPEDQVETYSWSDIAMMLDAFLFKVYLVFVVMATLCFFVTMSVGGHLIAPSLFH